MPRPGPFPESQYTPETHPWRGRTFVAWTPGTYLIDGVPYCKNSWILSLEPARENPNVSVFNSLDECWARATECGGTLVLANK